MKKSTELVPVAARDLQIIEYRGQRVVTTEQLAAGYGATPIRIRQNHSRNEERFVVGKHYFLLEGDELRELKHRVFSKLLCENCQQCSIPHPLDRTRRSQPRKIAGNGSGVELSRRPCGVLLHSAGKHRCSARTHSQGTRVDGY
ncbi:TPA: ORF6N domain-containing protein [Escherichia coli]